MTRRAVTAQYPDVKPELPPRSRGVIAPARGELHGLHAVRPRVPRLVHLHRLAQGDDPGHRPAARERQRNVLDRFAIDFSLCMYCGICIEVCPFDALFWSPEFEYAELDIRDLTHEKDRLRRVDVDGAAAAGARRAGAERPQGSSTPQRKAAVAQARRSACQRSIRVLSPTGVELLFVAARGWSPSARRCWS